MSPRTTLMVSGILGALAILLGAFAAHVLKFKLDATSFTVFETAARMHLIHSVVLLGVGILSQLFPEKNFRKAALCFLVGILLFSGSLYALALTGIKGLGAITPLGGVSLICGWLMIAYGGYKTARV